MKTPEVETLAVGTLAVETPEVETLAVKTLVHGACFDKYTNSI